jgi:serine/threonine protein phosphatase PrpC
MGTYLSTPKTDKVSDDGENEDLRFGSSAMQGWRQSMEDAHTAILDVDKDTSIFGVYDGHGGVCITHLGRNFFFWKDYCCVLLIREFQEQNVFCP